MRPFLCSAIEIGIGMPILKVCEVDYEEAVDHNYMFNRCKWFVGVEWIVCKNSI